MRDRAESVLRIVCLALAGLILLQLASGAARRNPLARVQVPKIPAAQVSNTLAPAPHASTNSPPGKAASQTATNLPATIQARVTRISESEILGPVPRPPVIQAALLGIAGQDAFMRASTGKTKLVRVGENFDGLKLLQIGTNRVVIEEDGRKRELTVFSGFGSESLLSKEKENPQ
jgi:hypothetical protein